MHFSKLDSDKRLVEKPNMQLISYFIKVDGREGGPSACVIDGQRVKKRGKRGGLHRP